MASKIPATPYAYLSGDSNGCDLSKLNATIANTESAKQKAHEVGSKIKASLVQHRAAIEKNAPIAERKILQKSLDDLAEVALRQHKEYYEGNEKGRKSSRLASLSFTLAEYVRQKAYCYFLETGRLMPQSTLPNDITDEEYLSGIISMSHDLSRYAVGRATERDAHSVMLARDLVSNMLNHLMEYDFRNGNLRRKYDGVKYCLKTCETILYELSVTGCDVPGAADEDAAGEEPKTKRQKSEVESGLPEEELESLRKRMVRRDELRETLIKKCRDGQKAAKQAIYALHREDFTKAKKLIENCEKSILEDLNPIVRQDSQLRFGSFASVLEEYAEAKLFYVWLAGDDGSTDEGISSGKASGKLLQSSDFTVIPLEVEEYLGGLADLTGEVGRYAVKKGTMRDTESVKLSLETCMSILYAFEGLIKIPGGGIQKKLDQLKRTVEKLEKMLYELSLSEATGRTITAALTESISN